MYLRSLFAPMPPLPQTNFHNVVFANSDLPESVMLVDAVTDRRYTRGEFRERVRDAATALGAPAVAGGLGLTSECMIGILSDNCPDYVVLLHALLAITTPFALFSTYATPREMSHSLTKSRATHVFVHASLLSRLLPVAREVGLQADRIFVLDGEPSPDSPRLPRFGELIEKVRRDNVPREPVRPADKDTLAYLVFSSGTSGLPKAVMISHGNIIFSVYQLLVIAQETEKLMPSESRVEHPVFLAFLPFFHSYGLFYCCLTIPLRPATIVTMPRWNLNLALSVIPRYRVTTIPSIPSIIHQLVNSPKFAETDLSSLVSFGSGAAHLPLKLGERLRGILPRHVIMNEGYGMSEATIGLIGKPPMRGLLNGRAEPVPGSIGILLPGVEAMILRPDGTHCLPNEVGDLHVRGGNISLGYWNDRAATKESFIADGWLKTGDRFKANLGGTFWFEDRAKDTLKVSGLQVSPAEIEDVLLAEPNGLVSDAAVAGVQLPGARTSDDKSPRAWVVLSPRGRRLDEREALEQLERWAKKNLSKYKWLRGGIKFVMEIPKTPTGKVLRRVLQDQFAAESERAKL